MYLDYFIDNLLPLFSTFWGVFVFIVLYAIWVIFLLPGLWPSMVAGFLYGSGLGTIIVILGAIFGAQIAFFISRNFLSNWIKRKIAFYPKLEAIQKSLTREGLKFIFLTRLSPVFPFSLLNYIYGISDVRISDFTIGLLGIIPGTFFYCSLGSLASDISLFKVILSADSASKTSFIISLISTLATLGVVLLITRSARKALKEFDS